MVSTRVRARAVRTCVMGHLVSGRGGSSTELLCERLSSRPQLVVLLLSSFLMLQKVFEEREFQLQGLSGWDVRLTLRQERAILVPQHRVHGHQVIECQPVP